MDLTPTPNRDSGHTEMAYPCGPANIYSNVHTDGVAHLGNSYNFGPTEDQQILQAILQSLHYPEIGQRGRDVPDAGVDTFEWLFEEDGSQTSHVSDKSDRDETGSIGGGSESEETTGILGDDGRAHNIDENQQEQKDMPGEEDDDLDLTSSYYSYERERRDDMAVNLRSWLKDDGDSVFWVTGKPGSGKSTFMKFLRDHDGTDSLLREWAEEDLLIVADHFFWLPGTHLQKSFEGLARSLMHAILSSLTTDIASVKTICGKQRWSLQSSHRPWSHRDFKRMFSNLGGICEIRVFLLIDGLDECCPQHSHDDLMDTLMAILQQSNLKACLSSRLWREFATRLDRIPSLRLDWVTKLDMVTYVSNRIHQATRERKVTASEASKLVHLVVDRADGVFLWVELVVRAVIVELKKGRGLSRVSSIVEDFPAELDDYFATLIYERIEQTSGNVSDTASVFSLAIQLEEDNRSRRTSRIHRMAAHKSRIHRRDGHDFFDFWLLSRGILDRVMEVPNTEAPKYDRSQIAVMQEQTRSFLELASKDLLVLQGYSVNFLHRTVFDFLMNGSASEAIRQRSPPHFRQADFLPKVLGLSCVHALMVSDAECRHVDASLAAVVHLTGLDGPSTRTLVTACESLAIDHLHNTKSCSGIVAEKEGWSSSTRHQIRMFMAGAENPAVDWIPYQYIRAFFHHWPHTVHTMLTGDIMDYRPISHLRLRDLCSECTDIMNDCIYSGALPNDWIARLVPRKDFKRIKEKHVRSDDGAQRSICEFCKVCLPYSRDCGLRGAFFLFEKIAFEHRSPNTDVLAQTLVVSPATERQIAESSSFESPRPLMRRADGLQTLSATSQFQRFVWYRQKLRAVRYLLTTLRRHLAAFATDTSSLYSSRMKEVWISFIFQFIEPPANRDSGHYRNLQCDHCGRNQCSRKYVQTVIVFLRSDRFPLFCEDCYRRTAPQRDLGNLFVFTIRPGQEGFDRNVHPPEDIENRGIVKAISEIIAWYLATAPAYGLGHTVPSDMTVIQEALLVVPDAPF